MLFHWKFKPSGIAQISIPSQPPIITTTITASEPYPIRRLEPAKAHQYLGIQLTTDGNNKRELQIFQERTQRYTQFIHQCPLTAREARVVYLQCYLPTLSYPCQPPPSHWKSYKKFRELPPVLSYQKWDTREPFPMPLRMPHHNAVAWDSDTSDTNKVHNNVSNSSNTSELKQPPAKHIASYSSTTNYMLAFNNQYWKTRMQSPGAQHRGSTTFVNFYATSMDASSLRTPGPHSLTAKTTELSWTIYKHTISNGTRPFKSTVYACSYGSTTSPKSPITTAANSSHKC